MARLPWTSPRRQPNPQRCPRIFHAKVEAGSFRCNFIKIHRRLRTSHAMAAGTSFPVDSSAFVSTASSPIAVEPTYSPSVSSYCYIMLKPVPSPGAQSTTAPITSFRCPHCAAVMLIVEIFSASTPAPRSTPFDSS
jgi:hypothetical protein